MKKESAKDDASSLLFVSFIEPPQEDEATDQNYAAIISNIAEVKELIGKLT